MLVRRRASCSQLHLIVSKSRCFEKKKKVRLVLFFLSTKAEEKKERKKKVKSKVHCINTTNPNNFVKRRQKRRERP